MLHAATAGGGRRESPSRQLSGLQTREREPAQKEITLEMVKPAFVTCHNTEQKIIAFVSISLQQF
jgi:hypothetical protein